MGLELFKTLRNSRVVKGVRPGILRYFKRAASDFRYWLRSHTTRRYHMLDIRQPFDMPEHCRYRWGWIDSDYQIMFAVGNILCNYVENEHRGEKKFAERVEWLKSQTEKHRDKGDEIGVHLSEKEAEVDQQVLDLYRWWKYDRIELAKELDRTDVDHHFEKENEFHRQVDDFMKKVIDLRRAMWT